VITTKPRSLFLRGFVVAASEFGSQALQKPLNVVANTSGLNDFSFRKCFGKIDDTLLVA
jgi:hypothetical protein